MKRLVLVLVALTGCAPDLPPRVNDCWQTALQLTRSPSTAKIVDTTDGTDRVFINYDAANAYGTPVRTMAVCTYDGERMTELAFDGEAVEPMALAGARMSVITKAR